MKREREKNIRSGEPVQNIINVNIWVGIYISYSHIIIWKKKPLLHIPVYKD